ncbi:MAG: hypothetical protein QOJ96_3158 [Alphaproteobacteria bacterium]|jgi:hypothetical protein|nr:hypothetical protein [Alphaproteobacteria bacterium]
MLKSRAASTILMGYVTPFASAWLTLAIIGATTWLLVFTGITLFIPILDSFGFRQAQTAISVYSMLHDKIFIDYLTPVLGAPWALPFEAPIYQLLVAFLTYMTGLELDACGRIISVLFFFLVLGSGYSIIKTLLPGDRYTPRLFLLLGLVSPLYLFWARTFMIETCALGLGMAWLACAVRGADGKSMVWLIASVPLCVMAALAKATTWPAFVVAYGLYFVAETLRTRSVKVLPTLITAVGIVTAFAITVAWNRHGDQLRLLNPFGNFLTSDALRQWTFGTWSQLFSEQLWLNIVPRRILPDAIGYCWPVLLICIRYVRGDSMRMILALASITLFLLPLAIFTNLHVVHEYYQSANAIFAVAAAAFLLSELAAVGRPGLATFATALLLAGSVARFSHVEWPLAYRPLSQHPFYIAAKLVEQRTKPDTALIVVGLDWSSEIHYYAQRKGVALPLWATLDQAKKLFDNPDGMMGGLTTAAVIDCRAVHVRYHPQLDAAISDFVNGWAQQSDLVLGPASPGVCAVYIKRG